MHLPLANTVISIFNQGAKKWQDILQFVQILTINKTRFLITDVHRLAFNPEQNCTKDCIFHFNIQDIDITQYITGTRFSNKLYQGTLKSCLSK